MYLYNNWNNYLVHYILYIVLYFYFLLISSTLKIIIFCNFTSSSSNFIDLILSVSLTNNSFSVVELNCLTFILLYLPYHFKVIFSPLIDIFNVSKASIIDCFLMLIIIRYDITNIVKIIVIELITFLLLNMLPPLNIY